MKVKLIVTNRNFAKINFVSKMFLGIIGVLIIVVVFICMYDEIRKTFIKRKLSQFESPKQIPILGVGERFLKTKNDEIIDTILGLFDEVKTTPFQAWFGPVLMIGVADPQDLQTLLTSDDCLNRPYFYNNIPCKTSILVTNRETWKPHRRELNKAFNAKMLQSFVPILNEKSRVLLKRMESHLNKPSDLYRTIFVCMMDINSRTTVGEEMNLQSERGEFYYDKLKTLMNNIMYRMVRFWLRWDWVYSLTKTYRDVKPLLRIADDLFEDVYNKRMNEIKLLKSEGIDYLRELREENTMTYFERCFWLEQEGIFNHQNFIDQMRLIVVAGIDSLSIAVFGTLLMLAMNQKHQDLVVDELRSIFGTADCDVNQSHLAAMEYTERVIKESLRLIPPIPFIARKSSADIPLSRGTVPKNTIVLINIMHMHRNPRIWGENVLEFDPDRFSSENVAKRPPFSYIPFSAGPRNCMGMKYAMSSVKIALAHLLKRYKFTTNLRFDEIRLSVHIITELVNENPLRIEERNFQNYH